MEVTDTISGRVVRYFQKELPFKGMLSGRKRAMNIFVNGESFILPLSQRQIRIALQLMVSGAVGMATGRAVPPYAAAESEAGKDCAIIPHQ